MGKFNYQQITKDVMIVYDQVLEKVKVAPKRYKEYVKKNYSKYDSTILKEKDLMEKYVREQALLNYYFSILKLINPKFDGRTLNCRFYHLKIFPNIDAEFINSNLDLKWDWYELSQHPCVNWEIIVKVIDVETNTTAYDRMNYNIDTKEFSNYELIKPLD